MNVTTPRIVVLCGPNGSGKSTSAERLFRGPLEVEEFVNADTIAKGLSAFSPEQVALAAGHHVPQDVVRRRYHAGLANLRTIYIPLADGWQVVDNTETNNPRMIAWGTSHMSPNIRIRDVWERIMEEPI